MKLILILYFQPSKLKLICKCTGHIKETHYGSPRGGEIGTWHMHPEHRSMAPGLAFPLPLTKQKY